MNGAVFSASKVDPARIRKRFFFFLEGANEKRGDCDKIAWSLDEALKVIDQARKQRKSLSVV